jgi:hypothetical protein
VTRLKHEPKMLFTRAKSSMARYVLSAAAFQTKFDAVDQATRDRALQNLADLRRAPAETVQFLQSVSGEARQMESQDRSG